MRLSESDQRGIMNAAKVMAEAGRFDSDNLNQTIKAMADAAPTAEQAIRNFHANTKALKEE